MIDWMFMIFLIMAFMLIILIIQYHDDPFWGGMFTVLDIIVWFLLAATVLEIESPSYIYNSTLGAMEPQLFKYTSTVAPEMVYFFYMMACIMIVFFVGYFLFSPIYELVTGKKWRDFKE
jgi:hypothetical protein